MPKQHHNIASVVLFGKWGTLTNFLSSEKGNKENEFS
jgi:hypothetical protein